jgi:8-oxo-dGTP pyrophosphatase MutT (NUDIX family)
VTWDELRRALAERPREDFAFERISPGHLPPGGLARGAVLVPLLEKDGRTHVLLTKRRSHLRRHAGQWSFPGGRVEPGEESVAAALREAHEEIGLEPGAAEVLGRLDETLVLVSAFRLTPWVARVPYPYAYAPHPEEVEQLIVTPLADLRAPGAHRTQEVEVYGMKHEVHFFDVGGEVVWGATARVLHKLLGIWTP